MGWYGPEPFGILTFAYYRIYGIFKSVLFRRLPEHLQNRIYHQVILHWIHDGKTHKV